MQVVSGHIPSLLLTRIRLLLRLLARDIARLAGKARSQFAKADLAGALIRVADMIEAGFTLILRGLAALARRRGLSLTGGLLWRSVAAMSGIGLAAALVTGLSANGGEATLASLSVQPEQEVHPVRDVRRDPRHLPGGADSWVRIERPIAMFGLQSPELDREPTTYEARRNQDGSRREDVLAFGAFAEEKPHLLLRLQVEHRGGDQPHSFMIALVREAAARGMAVQRSSAPIAIQTRFGPAETTDTVLSDGAVDRTCIAFRMSPGSVPLAMSGWWCGAAKPADRQQLICLIDRLDLLNAGDDNVLRSEFARTETNRQPACAPQRLSATGRKVSWLDADGTAPALRTKSAAVAEPAKPKSSAKR
ncbi:hypothetical protein SAMN04488115_11260 [Bosea lathyri]|uniref:Uncharacterized protein n=1 Tax=Bosea lathyri TaxID=1036778 RepID=A0A1H6CSQ1_9HYPH|nr:hypothetical protein SAMN04488115_11260 [Bosea lathyri]